MKTCPSTSPVFMPYVPLCHVPSSPTPVLPGYPSILDTGLEYETDAEVDAADVFAAMKAAPMPPNPRSTGTMNAVATAAAAPRQHPQILSTACTRRCQKKFEPCITADAGG